MGVECPPAVALSNTTVKIDIVIIANIHII